MFYFNYKLQLHNFDSKAGESIFVGYSTTSKVHRVNNRRTLVVEESVHVAIDESNRFYPMQAHCYVKI